jgi:hypothetical protein
MTARGSEIPQSQAEFIQIRSMPKVSKMSMARAGEHFDKVLSYLKKPQWKQQHSSKLNDQEK